MNASDSVVVVPGPTADVSYYQTCPQCHGRGVVERKNLFGMPVVVTCPEFCQDGVACVDATTETC